MSIDTIINLFKDSINVKNQILKSQSANILATMGDEIVSAIKNGNKIMLCGNGGSAADAQHLAAEMLIRLRPTNNRAGIPAITLAQDSSTITACGNDFGYDFLYERTIRALKQSGDILIGISTSGNSLNILKAMKAALELDIKVFGFLGAEGGGAFKLCNNVFVVPNNNSGRVQESHITAGHGIY